MRKRSTGLLPFSAESEGERVICPDRAGLEGIENGASKGGKNGWIRCTARGMLVAGTFQGTSQIGETQAAQGVRALLKEVPLSPPVVSKSPWKQGLFCFFRLAARQFINSATWFQGGAAVAQSTHAAKTTH
ncbi:MULTISPECIES: hypothetical protein [Stenotrophomonas]|jgi:hypothetical protein|uniref:hypothetical protein n=1 Tax=Stenotrophomonas TaxID=40323 RepID=UPI001EE3C69F|nr:MULTISPECIES: hypothetical protein [Stenotrophomonas]MDH0549506.1 hypothetical protein [Stenotrophomonas sp. GD04006]